MRPLYGQRLWIMEAIAAHMEKNGWAPTVREIAAAVGLSSPSTVHVHLMQLQREGRLHLGGGARMIRVLNPSELPGIKLHSGVEQPGSSPGS